MTTMSAKARFAFHQRRVHEIERRSRFERLAHHEAAHAVCAAHFGVNVSGLCVGLDDDGIERGRCDHDSFSNFDRLVTLAAGGAAECRFAGNAMFEANDTEQSRAIVLAEFRDVRDAAAELERASGAAERIVAENWDTIAALARALMAAGGTMTRNQLAPYLSGIPRATAPNLAHAQHRIRAAVF